MGGIVLGARECLVLSSDRINRRALWRTWNRPRRSRPRLRSRWQTKHAIIGVCGFRLAIAFVYIPKLLLLVNPRQPHRRIYGSRHRFLLIDFNPLEHQILKTRLECGSHADTSNRFDTFHQFLGGPVRALLVRKFQYTGG